MQEMRVQILGGGNGSPLQYSGLKNHEIPWKKKKQQQKIPVFWPEFP